MAKTHPKVKKSMSLASQGAVDLRGQGVIGNRPVMPKVDFVRRRDVCQQHRNFRLACMAAAAACVEGAAGLWPVVPATGFRHVQAEAFHYLAVVAERHGEREVRQVCKRLLAPLAKEEQKSCLRRHLAHLARTLPSALSNAWIYIESAVAVLRDIKHGAPLESDLLFYVICALPGRQLAAKKPGIVAASELPTGLRTEQLQAFVRHGVQLAGSTGERGIPNADFERVILTRQDLWLSDPAEAVARMSFILAHVPAKLSAKLLPLLTAYLGRHPEALALAGPEERLAIERALTVTKKPRRKAGAATSRSALFQSAHGAPKSKSPRRTASRSTEGSL